MSDHQRERLEAAGTALFGPTGWQRPLAQALAVDDRLVRRWVSGKMAVLPEHWAAIAQLLRDRGQSWVEAGERCLRVADQCDP